MVTPRCPHCNAQGLKYLAAREVSSYSIICCSECGAIHGIIQNRQGNKRKQPAKQTAAPDFPVEIANADLSKKIPYSPEKMASLLRASGRAFGTQYRRIAVDDGPPACLYCKVDMESRVVPDGTLNSGRRVWICPNYAKCKQWELADQA